MFEDEVQVLRMSTKTAQEDQMNGTLPPDEFVTLD